MDGRQGKAKPGKGKARGKLLRRYRGFRCADIFDPVNKRDTQADIGPLFFTPAHRGAQRTEVKLNVNIRAYMQRTRDVQKEHANISSADTADVWLTKPEIPTSAEVLGIEEGGAIDDESEQSEVELEPNIIAGPWPDTTTYLRAHYQLLREDIVAPLRDAAAFMQDDPSRNEEDRVDLQIYDKVLGSEKCCCLEVPEANACSRFTLLDSPLHPMALLREFAFLLVVSGNRSTGSIQNVLFQELQSRYRLQKIVSRASASSESLRTGLLKVLCAILLRLTSILPTQRTWRWIHRKNLSWSRLKAVISRRLAIPFGHCRSCTLNGKSGCSTRKYRYLTFCIAFPCRST